MLPGKRKADGALLVTVAPPSATSTLQGGIAIDPTGAVHIHVTAPSGFVNGIGVDDTGALCVSSDPITDYLEGLPRTATGAIRTQLNQTPAATDPFLGGLRIGATGGLYISDLP